MGDATGAKAPQEIIGDEIRKGAVLAVFYFDVSAKDREDVQPALTALVSKLAHENGITSAVGEIDEPLESGDLWSSAAEVTVLAKSFEVLANAAIRYGPIGVEVLKPDKIVLSLGEAQRLLLNVSQIAQDFANYVLTKMMNEEEKREFVKKQAARLDVGRKLLEKKEN